MKTVRVLLLMLLAWALLAPGAAAKSFHFSRAEIAAEVTPSGAMWITERRAYDFDGSFSWATYMLDLRGATGVSFAGVSDESGAYTRARSQAPGTYDVAVRAGEMVVRWYFRAADTKKTFTLRYRVDGVVTRYLDTAELYWKFVGTGWDVRSDDVLVTVRVPGARRADLRAWGHGPLHGRVDLDDGQVRLSVQNLTPHTFVEGRILFPTSLVPGAPAVSEQALPRILEEEGRWAAEANRKRLLYRVNLIMLIAAPLAALLLWFVIYRRYGKEHRSQFDGEYYRELPARYPPAVLGALWRWGTPRPEDFAATIIDLARRGYLRIDEEQPPEAPSLAASLVRLVVRSGQDKVVRFTRTGKSENDLAAFEREALDILFSPKTSPLKPSVRALFFGRQPPRPPAGSPDGMSVTDEEFRVYTAARKGGRQKFVDWYKRVEQAARWYDFFDAGSERMRGRTAMAGGILLAGGFFTSIGGAASGTFMLGLMGIAIAGLLLLILSSPLRRRSPKGADQLAQWQAFRRFLTDFSNLKDAPLPALSVWEYYLVYAVTLGVADRVIEQMRTLYPQVQDGSYAPSWYHAGNWGSRDGGGAFASLASLGDSLSGTVSAALGQSSSS
ncbi:MAG: DUF2207 domain-containing protein, partial [Armatimonadetes bacterium]|nr:DUF2207 domain-containing protein [Armatimonadota bacterium]